MLRPANPSLKGLIETAHESMSVKNWGALVKIAERIIEADDSCPDGYYFRGVGHRVRKQYKRAAYDFEQSLELDPNRYEIAIELANMYSFTRRNADADRLLNAYTGAIQNNPQLLDIAAAIYKRIGLAEESWPLLLRANELQPARADLQERMAACAVYLGKLETARSLYSELLLKYPANRNNHYQYSRLSTAKDYSHIEQMKEILTSYENPSGPDFPLYFAIAKELEDLEQWSDCFEYYQQGCDSLSLQTNYQVKHETAQIDSIINTCTSDWLKDGKTNSVRPALEHTPIFITGLPRTGTTLVERIVSSHSRVSTLGETVFLPIAFCKNNGISSQEELTPEGFRRCLKKDLKPIADDYMQLANYRLGQKPLFIEKLPMNFIHAGLIAKAWPDARIVHMVRNPMDACFAMFKQIFTWSYFYSYSLKDLAEYYLVYHRLRMHWQATLGVRFIEVNYDSLVKDCEAHTRGLLDSLGLEFEPEL